MKRSFLSALLFLSVVGACWSQKTAALVRVTSAGIQTDTLIGVIVYLQLNNVLRTDPNTRKTETYQTLLTVADEGICVRRRKLEKGVIQETTTEYYLNRGAQYIPDADVLLFKIRPSVLNR